MPRTFLYPFYIEYNGRYGKNGNTDTEGRQGLHLRGVSNPAGGRAREYWIIDPANETLSVYSSVHGDNAYGKPAVYGREDTYKSSVLEDFKIDIDEMFEKAGKGMNKKKQPLDMYAFCSICAYKECICCCFRLGISLQIYTKNLAESPTL